MTKLFRSATGVDLQQPELTVRFAKNYGGMPMQWLGPGGIPLVHNHPGSAAQPSWNSGQDPTPASANGAMFYPLRVLTDVRDVYYLGEEAFVPDKGGEEALYQIGGIAPYFWASLESPDDIIPPNANGHPHRWSTRYNDLLNLGVNHYQEYGTPVYFVPTTAVSSGIMLIGNEITNRIPQAADWWNYLCRTEGGNIAFRMKISLRDMPWDGVAGVLFQRNIPATPGANIDTAWSSPGCSLFVNKFGGADLVVGQTPYHLIPNNDVAVKAAVNSADGVQLEVRTGLLSNTLHVYINGVFRGAFPSPFKGPHFGIYGRGSPGRMKFSFREPFDTGARFSSQFRSTARNTMLWANTYSRTREPFVTNLYRTILPGIFTDPGIRQIRKVWKQNGSLFTEGELNAYAGGMPFLRDIKAAYVGKADGSAGVFCRVHIISGAPEAHMHIPANPISVMMLNTLPFGATVPTSHAYTLTEWAPRIRMDLL